MLQMGPQADITPSLGRVRFAPESGHGRFITTCPLSARTGCEQSQQGSPLFDHLVGDGKHARRDGEAERLGGLEIEYQVELRRLLDRQV
jgi:hypothetical protein